MVNLLAKLDLDSSGFFRGLSRATEGAKKAADKIGKEVGKDFTNSMKRTIGAGAVVGAVLGAFKSSQDIRNTAVAMGVTAQEFAAMEIVARKLGDTTNVTTDEFQRLARELIDSGAVADNNVLIRLADDADRLEDSLTRVKAAATGALGTTARFVESFGAGLGGFLEESRGKWFKWGQFYNSWDVGKQFFMDEWDSLGEGSSIAERARRTSPTESESRAKGESTAKAEREERRRLGLPVTPFAERGGGSLASIGLGPGLGSAIGIQRELAEQLKRNNEQLRKLTLQIRRSSGDPL